MTRSMDGSEEFEVDSTCGRCRTCLGRTGTSMPLSGFVRIFEKNMPILNLLSTCASFQISVSDGLPQSICETCQENAVQSYMFRVQCENADKYLHTLHEKASLCLDIEQDADELSSEDLSCENSEDFVDEIIGIKIESNDSEPISSTCSKCNKTFTDSDKFKRHMKRHNPTELSCKKCSMIFTSDAELSQHKSQHQHAKRPPYDDEDDISRKTCSECGKIFLYRTSMLRHKKRHGAPPKKCPHCDFHPSTPNEMAKHMQEEHAHLKSVICNVCGKSFFKESNLRLHMVVHTGVKKHVCEICGMSFALGGNLRSHRRLHTGERPFTCGQCGRGFTQQSALRSHEAGHSDRKDHVCTECGAAFSRVGALRNHAKRHSGSKPFECTMCGKTFTFSSERKRHMTIHTGAKNFVCDVCGRPFNRSTNLKVHKRIHTGETPHVCEVCGKGFIQAHCLRTHMNSHMAPTNVF